LQKYNDRNVQQKYGFEVLQHYQGKDSERNINKGFEPFYNLLE